MPATTITINREQRDGLYELVRNHLDSVGDLWVALEQTKDFAKAEQLGHELAEDFRLMSDIGWAEDEGRERFELTMRGRGPGPQTGCPSLSRPRPASTIWS